MKLNEVLNKDQRSERFSGKRKRTESPEVVGCHQARRSVIQSRSELVPLESNLNDSDEDTQLHIVRPKVDKNLMKGTKSEREFLTDVCLLRMAREVVANRRVSLDVVANRGVSSSLLREIQHRHLLFHVLRFPQ